MVVDELVDDEQAEAEAPRRRTQRSAASAPAPGPTPAPVRTRAPRDRRVMRVALGAGAVLAVGWLALAGVDHGEKRSARSASSSATARSVVSPKGAVSPRPSSGAVDAAGSASTAAGSAASASGPAAAVAPAALELPTRVVKTGTMAIEVARGGLGGAAEKVTAQAVGGGGFVASSQLSEGDSPSGTITVRVPVASFEALVTHVRTLGRVITAATSGQDVTGQLVDLASRVDALRAARQQYLTVLSRASNIGDILNVQQHVNDLQVQIEQLQGQQKVLDDQASFSTLAVQLTEKGAPHVVPRPVAAGGLSAAWHRAGAAFTGGIDHLVAASGTVAFLVLLVLLGVAAAIVGRAAWIVTRRRLS